MRRLRCMLWRLAGLFRGRRRDRDLAAELDAHLQAHIDDNMRAGMTPGQAWRVAPIKLGGVVQTVEAYRAQQRFPIVEATMRDLRYALRMLRRAPAFAVGMIVRQGGLVSLAGITAGLATAFAGSRVIASLLYGVSSRDPGVFAAATLTLMSVALVACWLPARRAASVDPLVALRTE